MRKTKQENKKINAELRPMIGFEASQISKDFTTAIYERLREFNKSFWIVRFEAWVHPYNEVKNCFVMMFDGYVYYKFQTMMIRGKKGYHFKFRVAELPKGNSFIMDVKKNQRLTYSELKDKIKTARVN